MIADTSGARLDLVSAQGLSTCCLDTRVKVRRQDLAIDLLPVLHKRRARQIGVERRHRLAGYLR